MESLSSVYEQCAKGSEIKKHAQEMLGNLGLTIENLRGKSVLDLGAGDADLGKAMKQNGVDIVSMDRRIFEENQKGVNCVVGDADNIPFQNESFDLIISHAAPPTVMVKNIDDVRNKLNEVKRLLKSGGEFRFGPSGITAEVFGDEEMFTPEEEKTFTTEQRIERVKEKSIELLKSIDSSIEEDRSTSSGFYILKKVR
jgi:ubiquinone/menaquinone biosynthesis C-methylase UbiE